LKNIAGLWPLQQVRHQELMKGNKTEWSQMIASAESAPALQRIVNLDDTSLINPDGMQQAVLQLLKRTGQTSPESLAELTRLLLESLAMRYRVCLGWLESLLGYRLECLYIVGGGVQNELLCQMTADATNRRIVAAHSEATAIGNGLMQAVGTGAFNSIVEARSWLNKAMQPKEYHPQRASAWNDAWMQFAPHLA
jgi:rhamnulokinase